jgi:hypothetical protein
VRASNYVNND